MQLLLQKIAETHNSTVSRLTINGEHICFVIEDGYRNPKVKHETRISEGEYQIRKRKYGRFYEKYKRRYSHDFVLELKDVPNFTAILIHIGNSVKDTSGCLLPVTTVGWKKGNYYGYGSTVAYKKLFNMIRKEKKLNIKIER